MFHGLYGTYPLTRFEDGDDEVKKSDQLEPLTQLFARKTDSSRLFSNTQLLDDDFMNSERLDEDIP
jgi:hypothetical protein